VIFNAVALGVVLGAGVCVASGVGVADVVDVADGSGLGDALAACVGFGAGVVTVTGLTGTAEFWAQPAMEAASAKAVGTEYGLGQIESLRKVVPSCGESSHAGPRRCGGTAFKD
jgi:hypothetical protein